MPNTALASKAKLNPRLVPSKPSEPTYANISKLPMSIDMNARWNPMPATRIEPVMAPVMIIGKPIHTIDTENVLRRALAGMAVCSYSSPRTRSAPCGE